MKWTKEAVLNARRQAEAYRYQASKASPTNANKWINLANTYEEKAREGGMAIGMEISPELNEIVQDTIDRIQCFTEKEFVADELVAALHNTRASILRGELVREET